MSITYEAGGSVATITLDDGKVNAMVQAFFDELNGALDRAEEEGPVAVVLCGPTRLLLRRVEPEGPSDAPACRVRGAR
jgi:hypothetical protein